MPRGYPAGVLDLTVLPAEDQSVRCADFTRELLVDPGGTAIRADRLIVVETPLPWPKPVFAHPLLVDVPDLVADAPIPTRVLAAVPEGDADHLAIVAYDRMPGGASRQAWTVDEATLAASLRAVIHGADPEAADVVVDAAPAAEVWVCAQGSHDLCCGADGTRLAMDIAGRWDDVVVRRVSHTGGHRFAPTAITLPDGRMWAYLDPAGLHDILTRTGDPAALAERCRGWWGAAPGPAQVAERALLSMAGWAWELAPRSAEVIDETDGVTTVRIEAGEAPARVWHARVRVGRHVPTIACRAPGGLPAKPGVEYELIDVVAT
jgi:hypothetical protein